MVIRLIEESLNKNALAIYVWKYFQRGAVIIKLMNRNNYSLSLSIGSRCLLLKNAAFSISQVLFMSVKSAAVCHLVRWTSCFFRLIAGQLSSLENPFELTIFGYILVRSLSRIGVEKRIKWRSVSLQTSLGSILNSDKEVIIALWLLSNSSKVPIPENQATFLMRYFWL